MGRMGVVVGVLMWLWSVKEYFGGKLGELLRGGREGGEVGGEEMVGGMEGEVRGVRDGDVSKVEGVYDREWWGGVREVEKKGGEGEELKKGKRENS